MVANNQVQIVIKAQDQASAIVKQLQSGLSATAITAEIAASKVALLGSALAGLGSISLTKIAQLSQSLIALKTTVSGAINYDIGGTTPLDIIKEKAKEAIGEVAPLKDLLSSLSESKLLSLEGIAPSTSQKFTKDIEKRFDSVSQKLSASLVKGLTQIPVQDIPIVNKLFDQSKLPTLVQGLDKSLSDVLLTEVIGNKMPKLLRSSIQSVFGEDLARAVAYSLKSPQVQSVSEKIFSDPLKRLLAGSAIGAIEKKLSDVFSLAFNKSFVTADNAIGKLAFASGQKLVEHFFKATKTDRREAIESFFGAGTLTKIDEILPKVSQKIAEAAGIAQKVEDVAGELALITAGSVGALGVGAGAGVLLEGGLQGAALGAGLASGPGDNVATELLRAFDKGLADIIPGLSGKFSNGLISGIGESLVRSTNLPQILETKFGSLVQKGLTKAVEMGLVGIINLPNQLGSFLKSSLPGPIVAGFDLLEKLYPKQFARIKESIDNSLKGFGQNILAPLITSPIQKAKEEIKTLEAIANNEQAEKLRQRADRIQEEFDQRAEKNFGKVRKLRNAYDAQNKKASDGNAPEEEKLLAANRRDAIKSEIDDIIKFNKYAVSEVNKARAKASTLDVAPEARKAAAAEAEKLNKQLEETIKISTEQASKYDQLKEKVAQSNIPLEEQIKLIGEIDKQMAFLKEPFQSPIEKLSQNLSKAFVDLASGQSDFSKAFQAIFNDVDEFTGGALTELKDIFADTFSQIGKDANKSFGAGMFQGLLNQLAPALEEIDGFVVSSIQKIKKIPEALSRPLDVGAKSAAFLIGVNEPLQLFGAIQTGAAKAFDTVSQIGQQITFFSSGLQTLQQLVANGPFDLLIGQNIRLKEQMLATQTSLAATNKIVGSFSGEEITFNGEDPTAPIVALQKPVEQAIAKVRQYSLELSGVTSSQLIESFQIIAGQAGSINISLNQAAQLTKSFSGAMGVLGIPLFQARQEISSIVQGTIDQNSVLAKSIGLTNEQVRLWKSQGTIYQNLVDRLKAFESGNLMASRTVGGFASNIQEIFEEIGRKAGEPLLDPIVQELESVYKFLQANMGAISSTVGEVAVKVFAGIQAIWNSLKGLLGASQGFLTTVPVYLFNSLANALQATAKAIDVTVAILRPAIETFSRLFEAVKPLGGPLLDLAIQAKALQIGITGLGSGFGILGNLLPGVGELLFGVNMRMLPMLNMLPNLAGSLGTGAAGFLLLGQNMNAIPGLSGMVASKLGPVGPLVAGLLPTVAGFGITIVGVAKMVPFLDNALKSLFAANPGVLAEGLARIAKTIPALAPFGNVLDQMAAKTVVASQGMTVAGIATQKFQEAVQVAKVEVRKFLVSTTLMAAGLFAAFYAFDNFILKNKALMDTLSAVSEGLKTTGAILVSLATNPAFAFIATLVGLVALQMSGLYGVVLKLVATQLAGWAIGVAAGLDRVAKILAVVKLAGLAGGASKAAIGLKALGLAMTQGTAAAAAFLSANGVATIALPGLGAAATGASGGFAVLATSVWSAVAGLVALLAPFAAVAAALASIGLLVYSKQMADSTEATEEYGKVTDVAFSQALTVAQKIKKAKEDQASKIKDGIKLTQEEYAQNKRLLQQAKDQEQLLNQQIATLKTAQKEAKGQGNKDAIEAQIQSLEKAKKTLENISGDIQLAPKELPRLGTMYEQLAQKAAAAEEAVKNSSGDSTIFKQKIQELIEVSQAELAAGKITEEEVRRRMSLIVNNTAIETDLQIKAQEAITESYKTETQKQIEAKTIQQAQIEALSASGEITEVEAAKRITESKNEELQLQLNEAERVHKRKMELLDEEFKKTIDGLNLQLEGKTKEAFKEPEGSKKREAKLEEVEAINTQIKAATEAHERAKSEAERQGGNERQKLQAERAKNIAEGNKRVQDAQIKEIEKSQKKALDAATAAENDRLIQKKALLKQGNISQAEYDEAAANSTLARTEKELQAEQDKMAKLQQLLQQAPDKRTRKEVEEQIQASRLKTQDLTKSSLDNEQKAYESHINTIRSAIERDQTKGQIDLEKAVNSGAKSQVDADAFRAAQTVQRLQKEVSLETRNKDKRLKLELELQQALGKLREAETNQKLAALDRQFTQSNIQLQKGINSGRTLEESASAARAAQQVRRLEEEIKLSATNKDKKLKLELELQQALKALDDARIAEKLATLKRANLLEQAASQDKVNAGAMLEETLAKKKAQAALVSTQTELNLVKKGSTKYAELMLQRSEQVKAVRDAEIAEKLAILKKGELKEQIELQKGINSGAILEETANTKKIQQSIKATEAQLKLEKAGSTKALELEKTKLEQIEQLRQAKIAEKLAQIKRSQLIEQAELQRGVNAGSVLEETAAKKRAEGDLKATEASLALERKGSTKYYELQVQREQQVKAVRDAAIAEKLAFLKKAELKEQIELQKGINSGTILEEVANTKKIQQSIKATEAQLQLEKTGSIKALELEKTKLEQLEQLRQAKISEKLANLKRNELKEQIELQKGINSGTVLEETANTKKIQQSIKATESQLQLERAGSTKALELEKTKLEQLEQLRQAKISEKLAQIKRSQLLEEAALQEGINSGTVLEETASRKRAESEVSATQAELNETRQGTTKYAELLVQRNQKIKALKDAQVAEKLAAIDRESTKEQIELQKGINSGTVLEETVGRSQAEQRVRRLEAELAIQKNNAARKLQLEKEYYEALKSLQDAKIAEKQAANKRAQLIEEIGLQKAINQGLVYEEEASVKKAQMAIAATDSELALTNKGTTKYLELLKQREDQAGALKESKKQERLAALNREQLAEQIGLQNAINQGLVREERANTIRAQQTLARIQKELSLETTNRTKILDLKKQLAEAEKALQDAQLAEYKARLDQEIQAFDNKVAKQNQALQEQLNLYDMLGKALENQSRLLNARKDLAAAETDYVTGSIDLIAQSETSEYKKRQLAETTAAIKLKALEQQLEYDRQSLELEERKNKLALEREIIQNRMSQAQAEVDIAKARANLATVAADPKATKEQKDAAQLQLSAEYLKRNTLKEDARALDERRGIEEELAQGERRKFAMRAQSQTDKAQFDLINTLPPGTKNAYMRAFRENLAEREFEVSSKQLRQGGVASSRNLLKEIFPDVRKGLSPNLMLEAYDPELGALTEVLSGQEAKLARDDAQAKFDTKYGDTRFTVPNAYAPPAPELKIPTNIADKLIAKAGKVEPFKLPQTFSSDLTQPNLEAAKQLTFLSKDVRRGALQTPGQINLVKDNFDELNRNIGNLSGNKTYNVTVNFPNRSAQPVTKAEILAGIGRAIQQAERSIL